MASWETGNSGSGTVLHGVWPDAIGIDTWALAAYLDAAKQAVLAYAPTLVDDNDPPQAYVLAQCMQARNIWNSARANPATGDIGGEGYGLSTFPLDWQVKQILRPKRAVPKVR